MKDQEDPAAPCWDNSMYTEPTSVCTSMYLTPKDYHELRMFNVKKYGT